MRSESPLPHQLPYRADIDGLRAIAVLAVVVFHAAPGLLRGGFVGVDIFFVISGFLISSLIYDATEKENFSILGFYDRRIRRILPALLVVLAVSLAVGWVALLPDEFVALAKMVIGGSFYVPNLVVWKQTNYFAAAAENTPLLHLWSLGIEEQFYFIWPFLVALFWRRKFILLLSAMALTSFAVNVGFVHDYPTEVFYFPITRFWELLAGAYLAWRERSHIQSRLGAEEKWPRWLCEVASATGMSAILVSIMRFTTDIAFPGWLAAIPIAASMLIIAAGPRASLNRYVLANPFVVFIGLLSYPLYLWHWPLLSFLHIVWGEDLPRTTKLAAVLAALVLSWLTYLFIERPVRKLRAPKARKWAVTTLLSGSILTAFFAAIVLFSNGFPDRFPKQIAKFAAYQHHSLAWRSGTCFLQPEQGAAAWLPDCVDRPADHKPLVLLWGDSHAAHLRAGLLALQSRRHFRLGQMTASSCPPVINFDAPGRPHCRDINNLFVRQIRAVKPDIVILAGDWYDSDVNLLAPSIAALKKDGISRIVLVGPVPKWKMSLPSLLVRLSMLQHTGIPQTLPVAMRAPVEEETFRAFARKEGISYASPLSLICGKERCLTMTGPNPADTIAYDGTHLTDAGSIFVIRSLADQLLGPAESH